MDSEGRTFSGRKMRGWAFAAYLLASLSSFAAQTQTAVIPPQHEFTPGRTSASIMGEGLRYMGVYSPSDFITAMPEGGAITAIRFRLNEQIFPDEDRRFDFPDVEIRMSTITPPIASPNSIKFDNFVGPDETVVFRGPLKWQTEIKPGSVVNPFDIDVDLQRAFHYDPRLQSLVLDIRTHDENLSASLRVDTMDPESASFSLAGPLSWPEAFGFFYDPPVMDVTFVPGQSTPHPKVAILWPTPTNTYSFAKDIRLKIKIGVHLVDVEKIDVYANDALIGRITAPPYNLIWTLFAPNTNTNGVLNLKAIAHDRSGAVFESLPVPIVFTRGGQSPAPIVEIVSPRPFHVIPKGEDFEFEAEVLASSGDAGPVEFSVGGIPFGPVDFRKLLTKDAAPSRVLVRNLEHGNYLLSVIYRGLNGNSCQCTATDRIVRVTNFGIDPNSLQITDDSFRFVVVTAKLGRSTLVQRSTNLQTWTTITNFVPTSNRIRIVDSSPGEGSNSYRVLVQ